jgi:hypothetical protein
MDLGDLLAVDASTLTVVDEGLGAIAVDYIGSGMLWWWKEAAESRILLLIWYLPK